MAKQQSISLKPPALRKGDVIGIIAPASPPSDQAKVERGARYFERLGYRVEMGASVSRTRGYLAGNDSQRVDDLHTMFSDRRVKAIICVRGGYGTPRLLPLINYKLIKRNPKILMGFSDITALQLALWKKCRLVTFHGPMLAVDFANGIDPYTEESFWQMVTSTHKCGKIQLPVKPITLKEGKASGILLGGNLSLINSLLGTPYQPDFRNSMLFIEEVGEEPYRIDRMMVQLSNASILQKARGILTGQFTDCVPKDPSKPGISIKDILLDVAPSIGKPVITNLPFGHTNQKLTLPQGIRASVNTSKGELRIEESAVS